MSLRAVAALLALGACGNPTEPRVDPSCAAPDRLLTFVVGVVYERGDTLPPAFMPGAVYATVQKLQGCEDVVKIEDDGTWNALDNTLDEGDSNYLEAGTVLYLITGVDPTDALAVRLEDGSWHRVNRVEEN